VIGRGLEALRSAICRGLICATALAGLQAGAVHAATAADVDSPFGSDWLMLVMTVNTDPAQEKAFNDWYDHVDIPDVLRVPGYVRARRGEEQATSPDSPPTRYLALYDIKSRNIDRTIIDMLMASWGMEKAHRSTDLLRVTERIYYRLNGPIYRAPVRAPAAISRYLYTVRYECCGDEAARRAFERWYRHTYIEPARAAPAIRSVASYRLYRVLMDHPPEVPAFLTVVEIEADSRERALASIRALEATALEHAEITPMRAASRSIFLELSDVSGS